MTAEQPQNLPPWEKDPLERTDDEHVRAADHQWHGLGSVVKVILLIRDATVSQQTATNELTRNMRNLTRWLFGVTLGIAVLTIVLVLVALGVIGPAPTASAWVLWTKVYSISNLSGAWHVVNAFETKTTCETGQVKLLEGVADSAKRRGAIDVKVNREEMSVTYQERADDPRSLRFASYNCLPDTIDPRGNDATQQTP